MPDYATFTDVALADKFLVIDVSDTTQGELGTPKYVTLSTLAGLVVTDLSLYALLTDSRFTDARTPLAHVHAEGDVTNLVSDLSTLSIGISAAVAAASAALASHEADTTSIHGIANTANLVLTSDSRLSDSRSPSTHATTHINGGSDEINVGGLDGVLVDPQPPIIGATSTTAVAGNDSRLTNSRAPSGTASGDLSGTYPSPTVVTLGGVAFGNLATQSGTFSGTSSGTNTGDQTSIVGITGTIVQFNAACTDADFATGGGVITGTSSGTNTGDQTLVGLGGQPLDSDLTAIAALTTVAFGRSVLVWADAAAGRTALSLGTLATQSGTFSGTSSGTNTGDQDLSGYSLTGHVHAESDVTNLTTDLAILTSGLAAAIVVETAHEAVTTDVHGIDDTDDLLTVDDIDVDLTEERLDQLELNIQRLVFYLAKTLGECPLGLETEFELAVNRKDLVS